MRLLSVHPGVTVAEVVAATGFALVIPDDVPQTRLPTPQELALIRDGSTPGPGARRSWRDPYAADRPAGHPLPDRADRHGLGVRGPADRGHGRGRRARHHRVGDDEPRDVAFGHQGVKERTDAPFGVNLRADAPDAAERAELIIAEGVRVASFALAPRRDLIARLKDAGVVVIPSVGARRHAEKVAAWGADAVIAPGGEGGGHTGAVPTSLLSRRSPTRSTSR